MYLHIYLYMHIFYIYLLKCIIIFELLGANKMFPWPSLSHEIMDHFYSFIFICVCVSKVFLN